MTEMDKYQIIDTTGSDFISIFNFISRLIYCLENDTLNDYYNRRMIKPGLNERDTRNIHTWLIKHSLTENDISNMFYINYGNEDVRETLNVIFVDIVKEDFDIDVLLDNGLFKNSAKYKYVFIPRNFVDYDLKEKIVALQFIFYDIFVNRNKDITRLGPSIGLLLANLLYDIPDLFDQKLKQYLNSLLEYTGSGANYINFRTDKESVLHVIEIIESYLYDN